MSKGQVEDKFTMHSAVWSGSVLISREPCDS